MVVFAPMPRASVSTAIRVKAGWFASMRKAKRMSFILFGSQGFDWICLSRADGREQSGKKSDNSQNNDHAREYDRIIRSRAKQECFHQAGDSGRSEKAKHEP